MSDDEQRQAAHRLWNEILCNGGVPGWTPRDAIAQALAEAEARGHARGVAEAARIDRWIREAVIALEAATVIGERMHRTGQVEGLNLGNHDRLVREADDLRRALDGDA